MEDQVICRTTMDRQETARSAYWFWVNHGCPPRGNLAFWLQMERAHAALKPKLALPQAVDIAGLPANLRKSIRVAKPAPPLGAVLLDDSPLAESPA